MDARREGVIDLVGLLELCSNQAAPGYVEFASEFSSLRSIDRIALFMT